MKLCLALILITALVVDSVTAGYSVPMSHVRSYVGQSVNDGECASGVQEIFRDYHGRWILRLTRTWRRGQKVLGNRSIPAGTAIASFTSRGRYWSHTAIYAGQNSAGLQVYDQWAGRNFGPRTLLSRYSGGHPESNDADYFYVIEH